MKINKKATLATAGVLSIGALAAIFGTMAFFTDTTKETNTFTVGSNVDITMYEQQRAYENGVLVGLEDFEQGKTLLPLTGSEEGSGFDAQHVTLAKNYMDKIVTVENTGETDAYVRVYVGVPLMLDNENASDNLLHFNFGRNDNNVKTDDTKPSSTQQWIWKPGGQWNYIEDNITITATDGSGDTTSVPYAIYYADYATTLAKEETTVRYINGAYLDSNITNIEFDDTANTTTITRKGDAHSPFLLNFSVNKYGLQLPVYAVAVQADGFDSATAAMNAAGFTSTVNPFNL